MANKRHLANAPIREATIDIQFTPAVSMEKINEFVETFVASRGGQISDVWAASIQMQVSADGPLHAREAARIGKRVDCADGKYVFQFRTTGLTVSRLPKYETWEVMSEHAHEIWLRYIEILKPIVITRLAVRYINALFVPLPLTSFSEYFEYTPQVPTGLPQKIAGFLNRVMLHDEAAGDVAVITQLLEGEAPDRSGLNVLLDIDVSHLCKVDGGNVEKISTVLGRLRDFKNEAFFGFLKENILEQYT